MMATPVCVDQEIRRVEDFKMRMKRGEVSSNNSRREKKIACEVQRASYSETTFFFFPSQVFAVLHFPTTSKPSCPTEGV